MDSLFENAGEIITSAATNSLGFAALIFLICGVTSFWWFRKSAEWIRISIIVLLFVGGMLFAFASGLKVSSDEETPVAAPIDLVDASNNSIVLSSSIQQKLEEYLQKEEGAVTNERKTEIVEDALNSYLTISESLPNSEGDVNRSTSLSEISPIHTEVKNGFKFDIYSCFNTEEKEVVRCEFTITNQEEDKVLRILGRNSPESQIISADGTPYIASIVDLGAESGPYQVQTKLVKDVPVKGAITFENVPDDIRNLNLLEMSIYVHQLRASFTIQPRDIVIKS